MAKKRRRKRNPMGFDDPGYVPSPKKKKKRGKKSKDGKTKAQREALDKKRQYKERAKRMRGFFGDEFKASAGYDLRKVASWTPQQKAKVTKYFRVMAPRITGDFIKRRYTVPENLNAAIDASLQEKKLPGQTAVAFSIDPGERLEIKVKRGVATVKKHGIQRIELKFDKQQFLADPKAEIERVLKQTNANVFQILTGGQGQNKTLTRGMVMDEIVRLIEKYPIKRAAAKGSGRGKFVRPYTDWLNGLIAYPGTKEKTLSAVDKFVKRHVAAVDKRRQDHLDELSAKSKGISVKEFRRRRTITKRARAKGRR